MTDVVAIKISKNLGRSFAEQIGLSQLLLPSALSSVCSLLCISMCHPRRDPTEKINKVYKNDTG